MNFYEILYEWNLWGQWKIPQSHHRVIVDKIFSAINEPEITAIIGPRRSGKSTVIYQLMQKLLDQGIDPKAILHINFEEPALAQVQELRLLDQLYDTHRTHVYPKGKIFLFLDEIQNIPEWERWARARNDREDIKIILTGSSAQLMSKELATLLTGRHFSYRVSPLSFQEFLSFKQISLPNEPYPMKPPAEIQHALLHYLKWGGFPRSALIEDESLRQQLLEHYFEDLLYKDVIMRHKIRDAKLLRSLAIHLLTNTASLTSTKRLCGIFSASPDLIQSYCQYLEDAFLINTLPFYCFNSSDRIRQPHKIHAQDLGLRKVVSLGHSPDQGKLVETLVHNAVLMQHKDLFYWKQQGEIDLLLREGVTVTHLIQVVYTGTDNKKVLTRELKALQEAGQLYPQAKKCLLVFEFPQQTVEIPTDIHWIPVWQFLLQPSLFAGVH